MTPLPFVWPHALVFWAVFLWAYSAEFGIVRRAQKAQGASAGAMDVLIKKCSWKF